MPWSLRVAAVSMFRVENCSGGPVQSWQGGEVSKQELVVAWGGLGVSPMGVPWARGSLGQDSLVEGYLDKLGGCSPGTLQRHPRTAGPRCGAPGLCMFSCGRGSPAHSLGSRRSTGPRRPSPRSPCAGRCPRCAGAPPPRLGGYRGAGLSHRGLPRQPKDLPPSSKPHIPSLPPPPPALTPGPAPSLWAWEGGWRVGRRRAVPSVSQAPEPSAGQIRVSVLLRPNCSPWGSASGARHVKRKRCSCRAPPWVTFTGSQGVHGVLRRTSGQPSWLQVLNSFGRRTGAVAQPRSPRPVPRSAPRPFSALPLARGPGIPRPPPARPSPRRSPGRSCRSHRPDAAIAHRSHSGCCTCSRSPRMPRRWAPGKACFRYRT